MEGKNPFLFIFYAILYWRNNQVVVKVFRRDTEYHSGNLTSFISFFHYKAQIINLTDLLYDMIWTDLALMSVINDESLSINDRCGSPLLLHVVKHLFISVIKNRFWPSICSCSASRRGKDAYMEQKSSPDSLNTFIFLADGTLRSKEHILSLHRKTKTTGFSAVFLWISLIRCGFPSDSCHPPPPSLWGLPSRQSQDNRAHLQLCRAAATFSSLHFLSRVAGPCGCRSELGWNQQPPHPPPPTSSWTYGATNRI